MNALPRTTDSSVGASGSLSNDTATEFYSSQGDSQPTIELPQTLGAKFGRWKLGRELGRGGVAVVYQAIDEDLRRTLAIKTLIPERLARRNDESPVEHQRRLDDAYRRMRREAELTAGLDHPGIPPVHATAQLPDGRPYFCMRLIAGRTFAQILRECPADRAEHLRIFGQVAEIVAAAHASRVIHRDLKPGNVMVGRFGEVQVMDWGMAKRIASSPAPTACDSSSRSSDSTITDTLDDSDFGEVPLSRLLCSTAVDLGFDETAAGAVMGTFAYMPPEQAAGRIGDHDARTDVFALGAMLCQILLGRPPYRGESSEDLWRQARAALLQPVFDDLERLDVDAQLSSLCRRSLAAEPDQRPASALEVATAMREYFSSAAARLRQAEIDRGAALASAAEAQRRADVERSRRRVVVALLSSLVALLLLGASAAIGFQWQHARHAAREAQTQRASDRARAETLVTTLLDVPAAGVPFAIEGLQPLSAFARPLLTEAAANQHLAPQQRLHARCALAAEGIVETSPLVEAIRTASAEESANIIRALDGDRSVALGAVARELDAAQRKSPPDLALQTRLAVVALHLGEPQAFRELAATGADPAPRTALTDTLRTWHGELAALPLKDLDAAGLAALFTGLADIPPAQLSIAGHERFATLALELHNDAADAAVHSATGLLLRRWTLPCPALSPEATAQPAGSWHVNSLGMTLVKVPVGSFARAAKAGNPQAVQVVVLSQPFWLCDRETTTSQFLAFLDDTTYPAAEKPHPDSEFQYLSRENAFANRPARGINWHEAVLFCNWLSQRERRVPYYQRAGDDWRRTEHADGYRLPTEAEWELAARAGSTTQFAHGDSFADLRRFAVFSQREPDDCASRAPNAFGLFDLHGNVQEWCFDSWQAEYGEQRSVSDPIVTLPGRRHVVRGGSFFQPEDFLASGARQYGDAVVGDLKCGFRVARNTGPHTP